MKVPLKGLVLPVLLSTVWAIGHHVDFQVLYFLTLICYPLAHFWHLFWRVPYHSQLRANAPQTQHLDGIFSTNTSVDSLTDSLSPVNLTCTISGIIYEASITVQTLTNSPRFPFAIF